jgi:hypothetical protein
MKQKVIQEWVPDPPTPYTAPSSGYSPVQQEQITWSPAGYSYKGKLFSTYSEAKDYRDNGSAYVNAVVASGPATYSPQIGYYYKNGKAVTNMFYVRDPMTGAPITVLAPKRL